MNPASTRFTNECLDASASITMAGPDGVEPPSRVLETHSSPRHGPRINTEGTGYADPLVELTGGSVLQL